MSKWAYGNAADEQIIRLSDVDSDSESDVVATAAHDQMSRSADANAVDDATVDADTDLYIVILAVAPGVRANHSPGAHQGPWGSHFCCQSPIF